MTGNPIRLATLRQDPLITGGTGAVHSSNLRLPDPQSILWVAFPEWRGYTMSATGANTIAGYLEKRFKGELSQQIWYFDSELNEHENLIRNIESNPPNNIWLSVTMGSLPNALRLVKVIKSRLSPEAFARIRFVFGNKEFLDRNSVKQVLEALPQALVVKWFGEETALQILSGRPLSSIPNMYYLDKGNVKYTFDKIFDPADYVAPKIDWEPLNLKNLHLDEVTVGIESSRGCDKKVPCSFCYNSSISPMLRRWLPLNVAEVIRNIAQNAKKHPVFINFVDDNFMTDVDRLSTMLDEIERLKREGVIGEDTKFYASARTKDIYSSSDTPEQRQSKIDTIKRMKTLGFNLMFIGIESGSDSQLKRYLKQTTREENMAAIRMLQQEGIHVDGGFIMFDDLLDDSLSEVLENISFLREANVPRFFVAPFNRLIIYPNTSYEHMLRKKRTKGKKAGRLLEVIDRINSIMDVSLHITLMNELRRLHSQGTNMEKIKEYEELARGHGAICLDFLEELVNCINQDAPQEEINDLVYGFLADIKDFDGKIFEAIRKDIPEVDVRMRSVYLFRDHPRRTH